MPRRDTNIRLVVESEVKKALKDLGLTENKIDDIARSGKKSVDTMKSLKTAIGGIITVAALKQAADYATELGTIAAEFQNVEWAYKKIPDSTKLLKDMRAAVKGTVSDLELMRNAIIGIDLGATNEQIETFVKFARLEAVRKGSDTLTTFQNILGGVLRGSTELLDNFGISLTQLKKKIDVLAKEKLGKLSTGLSAVEGRELSVIAATQIMNERLTKAGDIAITDREKIKTASVAWDNLRVSLGKVFTPTLVSAMTGITKLLNEINDLQSGPPGKAGFGIWEPPTDKEILEYKLKKKKEELDLLRDQGDAQKNVNTAIKDEVKLRNDAAAAAKRTADSYFDAMKMIYEKDIEEWEAAQMRKDEWIDLTFSKNIEGIKEIANEDVEQALATTEALLVIWSDNEEKKKELLNLRKQYIDEISNYEEERQREITDHLIRLVSLPMDRMISAFAAGKEKGSAIWKEFLEDLKYQISRFILSTAVQTLLNILTSGAGSIIGGGISLVKGAQEGEYIRPSRKGTLRRVGENNTPEVIVPVSKLNKFAVGDLTLPGGFRFNPPPMAAPAMTQMQSREKIIDRSVPVSGKVIVETVAPDYMRVREHYIKINRDVLIDDTEYVKQFLSTRGENSEFD